MVFIFQLFAEENKHSAPISLTNAKSQWKSEPTNNAQREAIKNGREALSLYMDKKQDKQLANVEQDFIKKGDAQAYYRELSTQYKEIIAQNKVVPPEDKMVVEAKMTSALTAVARYEVHVAIDNDKNIKPNEQENRHKQVDLCQNLQALNELANQWKYTQVAAALKNLESFSVSEDVGAQAAEATSINMLQTLSSEVLARLTAGIDKKDEEIEKKANEVGESTHGSDAEKSAMRELTALDDAKEELVKSKEELTSLMENAREENIGAIQAALEKANSALAKAAK